MVEKQIVLQNALIELKSDNQPWDITVEGDSIIATWKWMDARFFSLASVTDAVKSFTFKVTLDDKGRWHEFDSSKQNTISLDLGEKKIKFGSSSFGGHSVEKTFTMGLGQNKQTGETGIVKFSFDTKTIKEPIREYLKKNGWKKAGLFS